jgi:hypothetical protein
MSCLAEIQLRWATGLFVSLVLGGFVAGSFLRVVREWLRVPEDAEPKVPGVLTGFVERLFFVLLVAEKISGAPTGMIAWISAKMAANWLSPEAQRLRSLTPREVLNSRFSALLTGLVAMTFAMIGGQICNGEIPLTVPLVVTIVSVTPLTCVPLVFSWLQPRAPRPRTAHRIPFE